MHYNIELIAFVTTDPTEKTMKKKSWFSLYNIYFNGKKISDFKLAFLHILAKI